MSLRILVVDDHAVVRRGVRSLLESHEGWEVCGEATTGRDAVEQSRRLRPDVVVMDLSLPELNGLDATRQILKDAPDTEVLVLTMHHSEELARDVLQAGARGYVLKSDADENLIAAVDSLRQHKPFLTSTVTEFVLDDYVRRGDAAQDDLAPVAVTAREREIIQLVAEGQSNKEAASTLGISVKTIEAHRANIMRKLHLRSVSDLVRYAIRNKIVQPHKQPTTHEGADAGDSAELNSRSVMSPASLRMHARSMTLRSSRTFPGHAACCSRRSAAGLMPVIGPLEAPRAVLREVRAQIRDVLPPLAQRGHVDFDDAQSIEQVGAKPARRRFGPEVAVGRGNDVHIDLPRLERADALHLAIFHRPQELGLQRERQLAGLVEEERAAVGMFEESDLVLDGAGKRAPHVTEQLALEQRFDDRGTVHRDEPLHAPWTEVVQRLGDQLLARPGLAGDQHRAHVRRKPAQRIEQLLHPRASADHPLALEVHRDVRLDGEEALPPAHAVDDARQEAFQPIEVERLLEIIQRAELHGLDGAVDRRLARHQDHLAFRIRGANRLDHVQAADVGHLEIHEGHVGIELGQVRERRHRVQARLDLEAQLTRESLDDGEDVRLVVDDQQQRRHLGHAFVPRPSTSRTFSRRPSVLKGFCRNAVSGSSFPSGAMVSSV